MMTIQRAYKHHIINMVHVGVTGHAPSYINQFVNSNSKVNYLISLSPILFIEIQVNLYEPMISFSNSNGTCLPFFSFNYVQSNLIH